MFSRLAKAIYFLVSIPILTIAGLLLFYEYYEGYNLLQTLFYFLVVVFCVFTTLDVIYSIFRYIVYGYDFKDNFERSFIFKVFGTPLDSLGFDEEPITKNSKISDTVKLYLWAIFILVLFMTVFITLSE